MSVMLALSIELQHFFNVFLDSIRVPEPLDLALKGICPIAGLHLILWSVSFRIHTSFKVLYVTIGRLRVQHANHSEGRFLSCLVV